MVVGGDWGDAFFSFSDADDDEDDADDDDVVVADDDVVVVTVVVGAGDVLMTAAGDAGFSPVSLSTVFTVAGVLVVVVGAVVGAGSGALSVDVSALILGLPLCWTSCLGSD